MVGTKDENSPDNAKFRDNFAHDEPEGRLPSQRALAVFRCRRLEILDARLLSPEPLLKPDAPASKSPVVSLAEDKIALHLGWLHKARPIDLTMKLGNGAGVAGLTGTSARRDVPRDNRFNSVGRGQGGQQNPSQKQVQAVLSAMA